MSWTPKFLCDSIKAPIILSDGRVTTCTLDHQGRNELANIYEHNFDETIKRYGALRLDAMSDPGLKPHCHSCYSKLRRWKDTGVPRSGWINKVTDKQQVQDFLNVFDPNAVTMNLELASNCNLRCIGCGLSTPDFKSSRDATRIDMDRLLEWVGGGSGRIKHVRLYHLGETWAHPRWAELTRFLKKENPDLTLFTSTNGMLMLNQKVLNELPTAGIDHIMFSIHGATQISTELYMGKAFKINEAFEAVRKVSEIRDRYNLKLHLSWKYLLFEWNDSYEEIELAQRIGDEIGFDEINFSITSYPSPSKRFTMHSDEWKILRETCASAWPRAKEYQKVAPMSAIFPLLRQRQKYNSNFSPPAHTIKKDPVKDAPILKPPNGSSEQLLMKASEYIANGKLTESLMLLKSLLPESKDNAAVRQAMGDVYFRQGELQYALDHYTAAVKISGEKASEFLLVAQGNVLRHLGQFGQAQKAYQRAIEVREFNNGRSYGEDVYLALAEALKKQGLTEQAEVAKAKWKEIYYLADHKKKVAYCPIPKNACTYFKTAMLKMSDHAEVFKSSGQNATAFTRHPYSGFHLNNSRFFGQKKYFSFVILRNPFERLVSAYANIFVRPLKWRSVPDQPAHAAIYSWYQKQDDDLDFSRSLTFKEFVDYLYETSDVDLDHHWRPQHTFLDGGLSLFDHVGRVEDLSETLKILSKKAKWKFDELTEYNATEYRNATSNESFHEMLPSDLINLDFFPSPDSMLTPEIRKLIAARYSEDFQLYKNQFNIDLLVDSNLAKDPLNQVIKESAISTDAGTPKKTRPNDSLIGAPVFPTPGTLAYDTANNCNDILLGDLKHPIIAQETRDQEEKAPNNIVSSKFESPIKRDVQIKKALGCDLPKEKYSEHIEVSPDGPITLTDAIKMAFAAQSKGISTKVLIKKGIYRNPIMHSGSENVNAVVLIEAEVPGSVILSGSEVVTNFLQKEGIWELPWPHKWGLAPAPPDYGDPYLRVGDVMRRREMIIIDGVILKQVLKEEDLEPGTFFVYESRTCILIRPLPQHLSEAANVEVAVHSGLLNLVNCNNVTIKGLSFQHDNSVYHTPQRAALILRNCKNILVDSCKLNFCNNKGLQIDGNQSANITVRKTIMNGNGCLGFLAVRCKNLLIEDCETSYNNWRGAWAGWRRGSPCGFKIMKSDQVTLRRHRSIKNDATGGWIDENNSNVLLEDCMFYGNRRGLHLEASEGPILVLRCSVISNRQEPTPNEWRWSFGSGIALTHVSHVSIKDCDLADNEVAQIGVRDDRETRVLIPQDNGSKSTHRIQNISITGNRIIATSNKRALLHFPDFKFDNGRFWDSLFIDENTYSGPPHSKVFKIGGNKSYRKDRSLSPPQFLDFETWKNILNKDKNSYYFEN